MGGALLGLARLCRRLGGRLVVLPLRSFDALLDSPAGRRVDLPWAQGSKSTYAIDWHAKRIYVARGTEHIGFIIHEAGHVFADRFPPNHANCSEWEWLGWEIAVARRLGVMSAWSRQNAAYLIGGSGSGSKDWKDLSIKERRALAVDRIAHAQKIGLLSKRGVPRSIR